MRASQIKSLQDSVFGGLGEDFHDSFWQGCTVRSRLLATGNLVRGRQSERAGPTDVELRTEADEIVFRRDDTDGGCARSQLR